MALVYLKKDLSRRRESPLSTLPILKAPKRNPEESRRALLTDLYSISTGRLSKFNQCAHLITSTAGPLWSIVTK